MTIWSMQPTGLVYIPGQGLASILALRTRRTQQGRRSDVLPTPQRALELADPRHEIGGRLYAVNRAAELVLGIADDRFHGGGVERRGRLVAQINLRRALWIVADEPRRLVDCFGNKLRHLRLRVDVSTQRAQDQERGFAVHDIG